MDLIAAVITATLSGILALFVFIKNRRSASNVYFSAMISLLGLYSIFNYLSLHSTTSMHAFFWAKMILYSSIIIGPLFFFFVETFPNSGFVFNSIIQTLILIWADINFFLAHFNLIFSSVEIVKGNPNIVPGPFIFSFGLLQVTSILAGLITLVKKYKNSTGLLNTQLKYITVGISISFLLTIIATIILPFIFGFTAFISLSPVFLFIAGLFIAYSILKHRLLDIRMVLARTVVYFLLLILLGLFYNAGLFIIGYYISGRPVNAFDFSVSAVLGFFVTFSFQPLRRYLEKMSNKVFFKQMYSSNSLLNKLSHIMASTMVLNDLTDKLMNELLSEIKIESGSVLLFKDTTIIWSRLIGKNLTNNLKEKEVHLLVNSFKDLINKRSENLLIFDELDESELKQLMRVHNISIILPLVVKEEVIGTILFGEKSSADGYTTEDIDVLKIFAPEAAVAIRNALSYEEIRKFNLTLKTEVDQATEKLKKANTRLQELDRLKDDFVSVASHELRTPMTAIKSYLWMALAGRGGLLNNKQKYYLERAYNSTDRLIKLVNDMLNVSRIEAGRVSINVQRIDIQKLVEETIVEIKPRADELGLKIKLAKNTKLTEVLADTDKIKEVLINLIGNSMKFTPKGGKISVSLEENDKYVTIHVTDTGKGIEKEDLVKLFQKFGLLQGSYTTNQTASQGTGLGLYISKSIITLHKGYIWAESPGRDKGATFSFSLLKYNERDAQSIRKEQEGKEGIEIIHTGI